MAHPTQALHIPDTQSVRDERHLAIQRVGVKDVRYPLRLRVAGAEQQTAALWSLDVALPAEKKGTHMSRFVAWLDALDEPLDARTLRERHAQMLDKLGAREGLPALPDSELALFSGRRGQSKLMQQLTAVVRDYFASPANTISL